MTYLKLWKEPNGEWFKVSYEQALNTMLTTYKDNQITRDMLETPGEYPCRVSYIKVVE